MVEKREIQARLSQAFKGLAQGRLEKHSGKVRDWYTLDDEQRLLVTTDRLSAFDRVVGAVPWKGQVLNELSAWWNRKSADIVDNHLLSVPDPNASVVRLASPLPVEVIVRGYITGVTSTALWYRYSQGERSIYGYSFPEGLKKNQRLPEPIITPTTKALPGFHDERLTVAEVVEKGYLQKAIWERVMEVSLALFDRGSNIAADAGLILVDTKYEFGLAPDGTLLLIDEIHTPDSSRFWKAESYQKRLGEGLEPELFDKEFVRLCYAEVGYRGDGELPLLTDSVWTDTALLYQKAYELLTGEPFNPGSYPVESRLVANLAEKGIEV
ncbi:MAG: phosphoribosylaminoimidazolesuccinocarboxamide synthase [Spirochaetia bacterium]|jgi:phosphoribosylaminoimidazole-succinocarboxamide synthase|nr:phosphoribosylaminoimidazolesuccinocarboxamide synthase [Spirochaetales bacterium]MDX9783518.1 phosphoribosylaminoimidazolesuccinocarboxamide synthase [Spirochaetia bacterium]